MTKWNICKNPMLGENSYRVYRKLREDEPLHSGNVEYAEGEYRTKEEALRVADDLNRSGR